MKTVIAFGMIYSLSKWKSKIESLIKCWLELEGILHVTSFTGSTMKQIAENERKIIHRKKNLWIILLPKIIRVLNKSFIADIGIH